MTDLNVAIRWYAEGDLTREQLQTLFVNIGLSDRVTGILLTKADRKKEQVQSDAKDQVDVSKFQAPYAECVSSPSVQCNHAGERETRKD